MTREVYSELRRRLGGPFTLEELAELYDEGTGWATDLAVESAPDEPFAWDARIVADAAFGRYMRAATDFAGGRRLSRPAAARRGCRRNDSLSSEARFRRRSRSDARPRSVPRAV